MGVVGIDNIINACAKMSAWADENPLQSIEEYEKHKEEEKSEIEEARKKAEAEAAEAKRKYDLMSEEERLEFRLTERFNAQQVQLNAWYEAKVRLFVFLLIL